MQYLFKTSLFSDPCSVFRIFFGKSFIGYASSQCTEITSPTGLLAWLLTPAVLNAARVMVVAPIYDIITPLNVHNGAADNATVKLYAIIDRSDRQGYPAFKVLLTCSLAISLSLVTPSMECWQFFRCRVLHIFTATARNVLTQEDFNVIFTHLQAPKLSTHDYSTLAEVYRDLHALLARAGQLSTDDLLY